MDNFKHPIPANFRVSQVFGDREYFYQKLGFKAHPGIDFAVPLNTKVVSASWGEVCEIGWSKKGWGIYIKVKHEKVVSLYAHLNTIKVVRGCYVTQGQLLGYSGNTGNSSGPHLHFGIYDSKKQDNGYKGYIDPLPFLKKINNNFSGAVQKIQAEINQIKKDGYTKKSMFIHIKYIEKILKGE